MRSKWRACCVLRVVLEAGVEAQERRAGDEAGGAAGDRVARAPRADLLVPQPIDPRFRALDVTAQLLCVRLAPSSSASAAGRDWRAAGSSTCRHRRPGTDCSRAIAAGPSRSRGRTGPAPGSGHIRLGRPHLGRGGWCRGGHSRRPARHRSARGRVPFGRIVAAGFPRVHRDDHALPVRIAHLGNQRCQASSFGNSASSRGRNTALALRPLPQRADHGRGDRRLGDAGGQADFPVPQTAGPGK